MGAMALEMLVNLIEKKDIPRRNILAEPRLIIRDSCP